MKTKVTAVLRAGAIGDLIQIMPAVKLYKTSNPHTVLNFICGKSASEAVRNSPFIDNLYTFDDHAVYHGSSFKKVKETLKISGLLKDAKDCFVLHEDKRWTIPPMLAGVPNIKTLNMTANTYPAKRYSMLLNSKTPEKPEYCFYPDSRIPGLPVKPYAVLAPGGGRNIQRDTPQKRWQGFTKLAELIISKTGLNIVTLGLPEDRLSLSDRKHTDLCGQTSLSDAYYIINNAELFIGNDSALLHLANCTKTVTAGVFTATSPEDILGAGSDVIAFTSGEDCAPCGKKGEHRKDCLMKCREYPAYEVFVKLAEAGAL